MASWMDGFKRDSHPSREAAVWERIAAVYREYVSMVPVTLTADQHQAIFDCILGLSLCSKDESLAKIEERLPEGASEIIRNLYKYREPIYDIREEPPQSQEASGEAAEELEAIDKEQIPHDLPEELIQELLNRPKRPNDA